MRALLRGFAILQAGATMQQKQQQQQQKSIIFFAFSIEASKNSRKNPHNST